MSSALEEIVVSLLYGKLTSLVGKMGVTMTKQRYNIAVEIAKKCDAFVRKQTNKSIAI